jgi:cytochrome c oxidase assembly protein subunit 15
MWTEYLNRLLGVTVGFLILATFISAWRHHRREPRILWATGAALLLTGFEGWLGGRVVAHELAPWIVTVHLIVALVIVQMLLYATIRAWRKTSAPSSPLIAALIVVTMIQIGLGALVRGANDVRIAIGGFIEGIREVGLVDHLHRNAALLVLVGAVVVVFFLRSSQPRNATLLRWSYATLGLAVLQVALGLSLVYVALAPAAQVTHLTIASLLLGAETVLLLSSTETRPMAG